MPETTPEMLAMARRIAEASHDTGSIAWCAAYDAALAAIKEAVTTEAVQVERVIDLIEEKLCIIWNEAGREEFKTLLHTALSTDQGEG